MFGLFAISLAACTFGAEAKGGSSNMLADSGNDSETTANDDSADGMTSVADGQDDGEESESGATTTPMTDSGPMTSGPEPTSDTGVAETGAESSDGNVSESGETTGEPAVDHYEPCDGGCPDNHCGSGNTCAAPCDTTAECAEPIGGTAPPACGHPTYYPYCLLDCTSGSVECPPGMTCANPSGYQWLCTW